MHVFFACLCNLYVIYWANGVMIGQSCDPADGAIFFQNLQKMGQRLPNRWGIYPLVI